MPRVCSICTHDQRSEIDRALVAEESLRDIARRFRVSKDALSRHRGAHLPTTLMQAKAVQDEADAINVMAELRRCFERVNLLFDACDRWLRDADNPEQYDIGPRAQEMDVTYDEVITDRNGAPRTVRRKRKLSELLGTIESDTRTVTLVETRYADPRDLVLKTANRLQGQMELLSKLMGDLDDSTTINVVVNPQWLELRTAILTSLEAHPAAREAVTAAVLAIEGGQAP